MCIEYNGEQHYKSVKYFGGQETLIKIQKRDKIKQDFCENNNMKILIIKYNENLYNKIKTILNF